MTTYSVTVTCGSERDTFTGCDSKRVKHLKQNLGSSCTYVVTKEQLVVAPAAPKQCYYRGNAVTVIEARHNGYTLVWDASEGRDRYAVTTELEYR